MNGLEECKSSLIWKTGCVPQQDRKLTIQSDCFKICVNAESRCKCDKELSDSSLLLYVQPFHKQDPTAPCSFPAGNKAAIQHITSTYRDADSRHICNCTGLDPPPASPGVEQQFAVKPHQTSSSVVCLIPLYHVSCVR